MNKNLDQLKADMARWCGADQKNAILEELKFVPYTGQSLIVSRSAIPYSYKSPLLREEK